MAVVRFHLVSTLGPKDVLEVLTDFSPARAEVWPTIDAEHFEVHELGDTWAEVTEGTAAAWERARYEWEPNGDRVTVTTLDSKLFGAGRRLGVPDEPRGHRHPGRRRTDPAAAHPQGPDAGRPAARGGPRFPAQVVRGAVAGRVTRRPGPAGSPVAGVTILAPPGGHLSEW